MKSIILVLLVLGFTGCAHQTIHEFCSDVSHASKYKDYDQCYSEKSKEPAQESYFQAFARGFNNGYNSTPAPVRCTTTGSGYSSYTTCY